MSAVSRLVRRPERDHAAEIRAELQRARDELPPADYRRLLEELRRHVDAERRAVRPRRGAFSY